MKTINLIPKNDENHTTQLSLAIFQLALVGLGVFLLLTAVWLQSENSRLTGQTAQKQTEQSALKSELERARQLQLELAYIQDRQKVWQEITEQPPYSLIIDHIAAATLNDMRLTSLKADPNATLTISGVAADRTIISNFINQLNTSGQFVNPTITQANNQAEGVLFSLTSRFGTATEDKGELKP